MTSKPVLDSASCLGDGIGPEIVPLVASPSSTPPSRVGVDPVEWVELPLGRSAIDEYGAHTPRIDPRPRSPASTRGCSARTTAPPTPSRSGRQLNPERDDPQALRSLRQHPPGQGLRGRQRGRARHRPRDRPGEHRGLLRRPQHLRRHRRVHAHPDVAIAMGIITRPAVERIARSAFELAQRRSKQLTIVHKANVLKLTTGLFRDVCREVGRGLPGRHGRRLPHRRDDRAPRPQRRPVRRDRHREHVRRHPLRPRRRDRRLARHRPVDQLLLHPRHGPGRTRLRARHRRAEHRQPHRDDPLRRDAARLAGRQARRPRLADAAVRVEKGVAAAVAAGTSTRDLGGSASTTEFTAAVVGAIGDARP